MKNWILTTISALVATIAFGVVLYVLDGSVSYSSLGVFLVVYWIAFFFTTSYFNKKRAR